MKLCFLLFLTLSSTALLAQNSYIKTLDADNLETAYDLALLKDGNIALLGNSLDKKATEVTSYKNAAQVNALQAHVCIQKIDASAQKIWTKTYPDLGTWSKGQGICATADGGLAICGQAKPNATGSSYTFIAKINAEGDLAWSLDLSYGEMNKVIEDKEGNLVFVGYTAPLGSYPYSILIAKYNSKGEQLWKQTYGGKTGYDMGYDLIENDAGYMIAGSFTQPNPSLIDEGASQKSFAVLQINKDGQQLWAKKYDNKRSEAFALAKDQDGNFIIVGRDANATGGAVVLKIDENGKQLWRKNLGVFRTDGVADIIITPENNYLLATKVRLNSNSTVALYQLNSQGETINQQNFQRYSDDFPKAMIALPNGYLIAGIANVGKDNQATLLIKMDTHGRADSVIQFLEKTKTESQQKTITVQPKSLNQGIPFGGLQDIGPQYGNGTTGGSATLYKIEKTDKDGVYFMHTVHEEPRFPSCEKIEGNSRQKALCANKAARKFLKDNVKIPDELKEREGLSTRVNFIVTEEGALTNIRIEKPYNKALEEEIIRVLKSTPWIPGKENGVNVKVHYHIYYEK